MKKYIYNIIAFSFLSVAVSCTDSDLEPKLTVNKDLTAISTAADLGLVVSGAYNRMTNAFYYGRDVVVFGDARTDNAYSNGLSGRFTTLGAMDMIDSDAYARDSFTQIYAVIASCNIVINSPVVGVSDSEKDLVKYYKGESLALRALAHYDLVRLFGQQHVDAGGLASPGVAYIKDFGGANTSPSRKTVGETKDLIYNDLDQAIVLMNPALDGSKETLRTPAVSAIKARVALYFSDWVIAQSSSTKAMTAGSRIASQSEFAGTYRTTLPVNSIFELASRSDDNEGNNSLYQIYGETVYGDIAVLQDLKDKFSPSDVRGNSNMIRKDSKGILRNFGKFVAMSSSVTLIRFEEMVLINAESSFMINNTDPSVLISLNSITSNRGADPYLVASRANILAERQKELAFEGFRFDDIARTKSDMPVVDALKQSYDDKGPIIYGSFRYAFPIPLVETSANRNYTQNKGY
jgi:hypothetical protein